MIGDVISFLRISNQFLIKDEKRVLIHWFFLQILLSLLDLGALLLAGLVASTFVPIIQSRPDEIPTFISNLHEQLNSFLSIYEFLFLLAGLSSMLLILRSVLNVVVEKRYYFKLQSLNERLIRNALTRHFSSPHETRISNSSTEFSYSVNDSMSSLTIYATGSFIVISSEIVNITLLMTFLLIWKPLITTLLVIILGFSVFTAFRYHLRKLFQMKNESSKLEWKNSEEFYSLDKLSDELKVRNLLISKIDEYLSIRAELSRTVIYRQIQFGYPKLFMEISVILGGMLSAMAVWYFLNANQALVTLVSFMIVGFRLQPAAMKIQNGLQIFLQHKSLSEKALEVLSFYSNKVDKKHSQNIQTPTSTSFRLKIRSLGHTFADKKMIFEGFDLEINSPGLYLLKGDNGAGKTTLLEIIAGLRRISSGSISFNDVELGFMNSSGIEKIIAFCPQKPNFVKQSLIESFLLDFSNEFASEIQRVKTEDYLKTLRFDTEKYSSLGIVDLDNLLSEGEKLKIGVARTLSMNTPIVLLDEPSAALDKKSTISLIEILKELSKTRIVLIATHDACFDALGAKTIEIGEKR
jgi:ABC-type transport system involved in cytochrome bd biosynthesis fused ATPase/permease subunit